MIEPAEAYEHAGVWVEIVPDDDPVSSPQDNDNAGTIYSWVYDGTWEGDERISEPELTIDCPNCEGEGTVESDDEPVLDADDHPIEKNCPNCEGNGYIECDLPTYMRHNYDAVLTIPLFFSDYGSTGARLYVMEDGPNCAICFTQKQLDDEWNGSVDDATKYAEARVNELDQWLQGYVFGIVIRDREGGEVMESVWGFIGEPDEGYIKAEAASMAESCAEQVQHEAELAQEWAARGVVTVP
jgi:hypothetical protein